MLGAQVLITGILSEAWSKMTKPDSILRGSDGDPVKAWHTIGIVMVIGVDVSSTVLTFMVETCAAAGRPIRKSIT